MYEYWIVFIWNNYSNNRKIRKEKKRRKKGVGRKKETRLWWKVIDLVVFKESPIFTIQRGGAPKYGVEFRQMWLKEGWQYINSINSFVQYFDYLVPSICKYQYYSFIKFTNTQYYSLIKIYEYQIPNILVTSKSRNTEQWNYSVKLVYGMHW